MRALDNNLLSFTLWNYTPQNTNARGDLWNGEDLSLWSRDQKLSHAHPNDPYAGGRALPAVVRPYARKVRGVPLRQDFTLDSREFELIVEGYSLGSAAAQKLIDGVPTEVFVPRYQYPKGLDVEVSSGHYEHDPSRQVLLWWHGQGASGADSEASGAGGSNRPPRTHRLLLKDARNRPRGTAAEEWARYVNEKEANEVFTSAQPGPGGAKRAATHMPKVTLSSHGHVTITVPHGMQRDHYVEAVWARDAKTGKVLAATKLHPSDADHGRPDADEARLNFALPPGGGTTHVVAYASCNLHGVWSSGPAPVLEEEDHSEL
jgi:desulfoferrodoxin (superoxide reductase-like protein)